MRKLPILSAFYICFFEIGADSPVLPHSEAKDDPEGLILLLPFLEALVTYRTDPPCHFVNVSYLYLHSPKSPNLQSLSCFLLITKAPHTHFNLN